MSDRTLAGVRVLLVDDHPVVREGLSLLLSNKGLVICGEAGCRDEALPLIASAAPDIALVDLSLGEESGIDLITEIQGSGMKILVYSMHDDGERVEAALAAGADGYVTKREMAATLLAAIAAVLAGDLYLSPTAGAGRRAGERLEMERLSEREREVLHRMGEGYSTADLAHHFDISPSTVETYYVRITEKLGLHGVKELRLRAIRFMRGR